MLTPSPIRLSRLDYHRYRMLGKPLLFVAACLMAVVIGGFGHAAGGAARWRGRTCSSSPTTASRSARIRADIAATLRTSGLHFVAQKDLTFVPVAVKPNFPRSK